MFLRLQQNPVARLIALLLLMLPLLVLFLLPHGSIMSAVWFWLFAIVTVLLLWSLLGRPRDEQLVTTVGPRPLSPEEQPELVSRHMQVEEAVEVPPGVQIFRGRLRADAQRVFEEIKRALAPETVPMLQPAGGGSTSLILLPRPVERAQLERQTRPWLHWLLFGLTFLTTTYAGTAYRGVDVLSDPSQLAAGLPYSIALLGILGCHELGHYFTARRYRMNVTPPYFIPVPFALGTFGAFIQMRTPPESRRGLFDVAVAGPLAGLVIAIPALYLGLPASAVVPAPTEAAAMGGIGGPLTQASILMSLVIQASIGSVPDGSAIHLSPLAFAGWLGLLVTALNLIPVGQLDGGHIARSMLGTKAGLILSSVAMFSLFALALFVWPGLMVWAIIVFFLSGRGTPPLNDVTPLSGGRKLLGVFAFFLLALILIPMPDACNWPWAGNMRCPYL